MFERSDVGKQFVEWLSTNDTSAKPERRYGHLVMMNEYLSRKKIPNVDLLIAPNPESIKKASSALSSDGFFRKKYKDDFPIFLKTLKLLSQFCVGYYDKRDQVPLVESSSCGSSEDDGCLDIIESNSIPCCDTSTEVSTIEKLEESLVSGDELGFLSYLQTELGFSKKTCDSYCSAIRNLEQLAKDEGLSKHCLYKAKTSEVKEIAEQLTSSQSFFEANERQHKRLSSSLRYFLNFSGISVSSEKKPSGYRSKANSESKRAPNLVLFPISEFLSYRDIEFVDNRGKNGALWILGGEEFASIVSILQSYGLVFQFKEDGTKSIPNTPAWWTKDKEFECSPVLLETKYDLLKKSLIESGVVTLSSLRQKNLWAYMNSRNLYSIQQRMQICRELEYSLRYLEHDVLASRKTIILQIDDKQYEGNTPSEVFQMFVSDIAMEYPLRLRDCVAVVCPESSTVALYKMPCSNKQLYVMNLGVYIDENLSVDAVLQYARWIVNRCSLSVKVEIREKKEDCNINFESVEDRRIEGKNAKKKEETEKNQKIIEDFLINRELEGCSFDQVQEITGINKSNLKELIWESGNVVELNGFLYHVDSFVDFEEGATQIEEILEKLFSRNGGFATASQLFDYARSDLAMFMNDNDINDKAKVFDLAKHLFGKTSFHGKKYEFKSNGNISLPGVDASSATSIAKLYAIDRGWTVTYSEMEQYFNKVGLSGRNFRILVKIDKEPIFFVYRENEYLLSDFVVMDDAFYSDIERCISILFSEGQEYITQTSQL